MVSAIFTTLAEIVSSFATLLVSLFSSVVEIFYVSSGDNQGLTIIGVLTLISVAGGLVMWGFSFIRRLIKVRAK